MLLHRCRVLASRPAPPHRLGQEPTRGVSARVWGTVYLGTLGNQNQWSGHRSESAQEVSSLPCPSLRRSSQRAATSGGHLGLVNFGSSCAKYPPLSLKDYVMCTRVALLHQTLTPNFPLYTYISENLISGEYSWWREPLLTYYSLIMHVPQWSDSLHEHHRFEQSYKHIYKRLVYTYRQHTPRRHCILSESGAA